MRNMDTKCSRWAIFLSVIALVASITLGIIWIFDVKELSVVNSDTFISALIAVLGLLFTILMGWNIYSVIDVRQYRDEMNKTLEDIKQKEIENEGRFKQQTDLADAYAYYGLAEIYFGQKRYIRSYLQYTSAALYFKKAQEHNIASHSLKRINLLLRTIRRDLNKNHGSYVIDYDIYDYLSYEKDRAELHMIGFEEYVAMNLHETFMNYITRFAKHIEIENTNFSLYSYDADIKQRPIALYLLMKDNDYIFITMSYKEYHDTLQFNLDLNHDVVAVAEFNSLEDCKEIYDKIHAEIIKKKKDNSNSQS